MHTQEIQARRQMRERVIQFNRKHAMTIDQMRRFGQFESYNKTAVWANEMRNQGRIAHCGTIRHGAGRPLDVYCGWQPKRDNLRHEVMATEVCMCFPDAHFKRGYYVGKFRPDIEMTIGGAEYFIEIDCGTMSKPKIQRRWQKYKTFTDEDGALIIVTVSNPLKGIDSAERLEDLKQWSAPLYPIALFVTMEAFIANPKKKVLWDAKKSAFREIAPEVIAEETPRLFETESPADEEIIWEQEDGDAD